MQSKTLRRIPVWFCGHHGTSTSRFLSRFCCKKSAISPLASRESKDPTFNFLPLAFTNKSSNSSTGARLPASSHRSESNIMFQMKWGGYDPLAFSVDLPIMDVSRASSVDQNPFHIKRANMSGTDQCIVMWVLNMLRVALRKCELCLLTLPRPGTLPRDVDRHALPGVGLSSVVGGSTQGPPSNNHIDYPAATSALALNTSLSVTLIPLLLFPMIGTILPPQPLNSSIRTFVLYRREPSRRCPLQWTPLVPPALHKALKVPCWMSFSIS
ncbi:hypothetical protein CRG98_020299 [Punica granatum]|uniref:Uncharacterized protein n=1 Tax=Punica granatum TaxID=22663 RepID=A0A2I0JSL3_PUNGR|nr:hypothetical protein CRG98_020299 [Punica granatum]